MSQPAEPDIAGLLCRNCGRPVLYNGDTFYREADPTPLAFFCSAACLYEREVNAPTLTANRMAGVNEYALWIIVALLLASAFFASLEPSSAEREEERLQRVPEYMQSELWERK